MSNRLINIGRVTDTHGIQGKVRVFPLTDFPERFAALSQVVVSKGDAPLTLEIETVCQHKGSVLIKFSGYDKPEQAAALKGAYLQVPEASLVKLPEGHYYLFQIIGLKVVDTGGRDLGTITDVLQTGSNDVYVVRDGSGAREILVPALKSVVKTIDINAGVMSVALPPGLGENATVKVVRRDAD
jgi:16S rRNA processing protein RimM